MGDTEIKHNSGISQSIVEAKNRDDLFRIIFEHSADAIFVVDEAGTVLFINPGAERLFNLTASKLVGKPFKFKIFSNNPGEVEIVRSENESRIAEIRWIKAELPDETLYIASLRDITEFIRLQDELRAAAFVDKITGLCNRPGFFALAQQQLKIASRGKSGLFLFIAKVNDLLWVRSNYGDYEVDRVLVEIANALKSTFRRSDIITRIDRDEFAIMALDSYGSSADIMASRLLVNLNELNDNEIFPFKITLSMGIAPASPERPCTTNELLADANKAIANNKHVKQNSALMWFIA